MSMPTEPFIKLDQFLKLMQLVPSGGQAKLLIQDGYIEVNGVVETRRGRKLVTGDQVTFEGNQFEVNLTDLANLA
jgi:ribosome-associated protein